MTGYICIAALSAVRDKFEESGTIDDYPKEGEEVFTKKHCVVIKNPLPFCRKSMKERNRSRKKFFATIFSKIVYSAYNGISFSCDAANDSC